MPGVQPGAATRRAVLAGGFAAALMPGSTLAADPAGLRTLTRLRVGAAIDEADLRDPALCALYRRHCSSLTARNALKWNATERRRGEVNYDGAERIVAFARSIGAGSYGHVLLWYRVPGWVAAITDRAELQRVARARVEGAVRRFAGRIYAWDVVNELLEYDSAAWRPSVFHRLLGEEHVGEAFALAHRADPAATLVLNETHLEKAGANHDARRAMILDLVSRLRARRVPIHAVGLQGHFRPGFDTLDAPALGTFVRALAKMGVGVFITELDGSCRFAHRLPAPDPDVYGRTFAGLVRSANAAGTLRGVTTWGMREQFSRAESAMGHGCRSRALLYDESLNPRPALDALAGALRGLR
jgi:endo-1,4-beta-xylanase